MNEEWQSNFTSFKGDMFVTGKIAQNVPAVLYTHEYAQHIQEMTRSRKNEPPKNMLRRLAEKFGL